MAATLSAPIGTFTTAAIVVAISIICLRILNIVRSIHTNRRKRRRSKERGDDVTSSSSMDHLQHNDDKRPKSSSKIKTVVFLGSGGHTTEMTQLLQELDPKIYVPIVYIVAKSDVTSIPRLQRYILSSGSKDGKDWHPQWEGRYPKSINNATNNDDGGTTTPPPVQQAQVYTLPRAREVHQSYSSSIITTLHSTYKTAQILWKIQPHLIVTNGPGTCVPIVYCAFILRCLFSFLHVFRFGKDVSSSEKIIFRTIFIESLCRVKTLSLSGKLVYPIVDSFVVHWPSLMEQYDIVEICDVLVPSLDS